MNVINLKERLDNPLSETRITDFVHHYAREHPSWEAAVFGDQRLTYAQLEQQVERYARALLASGIQKGDRVAMLCTPRIEYWIVFLATTAIGAIWLGLNPKYRLDECRYVIGDAKPKLLFTLADFEGQDYRPYAKTLQTEFDTLHTVIAITGAMDNALSMQAFEQRADSVPVAAYWDAAKKVQPKDPALLVYTSGSTGKPKGAILSHYGLCFGAQVQNYHYSGEAEDRTLLTTENPGGLCYFPINHVACVADTCCVSLVMGGALHFQERFDPAQVLAAIGREHIVMFGAMPTMLLMLLDHPDFETTDFSAVQAIAWGGAALPEPVAQRLYKITPNLINVYGMTETAANTCYSRYSDSLEEKCHSIGRPSPYMPCRIVNREGELCAPLAQGELQFKGEYLMLGYLNRPEATAEVFTDDGWMHTGDVGYWREDGCITLVGRLSDMFKSGGYNVYPREIEILLETHAEVDMAAVVSRADPLYQEVGVAYVLPKSGASLTVETLGDFCKQHLANYKVPKDFIISAELPILPVGKIDKVTLKRMATAD